MEQHTLDPIALVAGLITLAGGVVALLHQTGTVELGAETTTIVACVMLGVAGALGVLCARIGADAPAASGPAGSTPVDSTSAVAGDATPRGDRGE